MYHKADNKSISGVRIQTQLPCLAKTASSFTDSNSVRKGALFMKSKITRTVHREICAKRNDNVICNADCGVLLCR